jgi:carbon-monoxide dehydrogenase small subunit
VALGPVKLAFLGDIHVVTRDEESRTIRALAQAADAGGGNVQADVRISVAGNGAGSAIHAEADLHMTGRIAQFGRSLANDVSKEMFGQFTAALDATARGVQAAEITPPSALALLTQLTLNRAKGAWNRLRGRN